MKFFASLFKRDELQRRGITIDEEVGHGTYSKVYKGRLRRSEEVSTARCPSVTVPDRDTVLRKVLNERRLGNSGPKIFLGVQESDQYMILVTNTWLRGRAYR